MTIKEEVLEEMGKDPRFYAYATIEWVEKAINCTIQKTLEKVENFLMKCYPELVISSEWKKLKEAEK